MTKFTVDTNVSYRTGGEDRPARILAIVPGKRPIGQPTNAYRKAGDRTPPSLDGLYDRMTPDHARIRINQFLDLVGNR